MTEQIDIVAIRDGNVIAMAYSDNGGPDDAEFIADHPNHTIQRMPVSEAVARHLAHLKGSRS